MQIHFEKAVTTMAAVHAATFTDAFGPLPSSWVEHVRQNAAKFIFDEFPPVALEEVGADLARKGLLALPFPTCYFEWPVDGKPWALLAFYRDEDQDAVCLWSAGLRGADEWGCNIPSQFGLEKLRARLAAGGSLLPESAKKSCNAECLETSLRELLSCLGYLAAGGTSVVKIDPMWLRSDQITGAVH
jgi:hypothetical protein